MPTKLLIIVVTSNAVLGQLLLKRALADLGGPAARQYLAKFALNAIASPWIYISIIVQGFGFFLWLMLISRVKLGVAAASVGAGFYILLPLSAWALFGETLTSLQWIGMGLIMLGVTCVSLGTA
jgi:drug/metabolite transporter (DMT)-like permease